MPRDLIHADHNRTRWLKHAGAKKTVIQVGLDHVWTISVLLAKSLRLTLIIIDGQILEKPLVEKPLETDKHDVIIYFKNGTSLNITNIGEDVSLLSALRGALYRSGVCVQHIDSSILAELTVV